MSGVTRHFLGWSRPILQSAADLLLTEGRAHSGDEDPSAVDLSSSLIALPGGRAGRRLLELLLLRCEALGVSLIPPRIVTVGSLPEEMYRADRPAPPPLVERLVWAAAIAEAERDGIEMAELLPGASGLVHEGSRDALAGSLRSLHQEVGGAGLNFSEVAERCARSTLYNDANRWRIFAEIESRYSGILVRSGFLDRTEARRTALTTGSAGGEFDLWVIGAPDLSPLVRNFLLGFAAQGSVELLIAAPEAMADHFDELGCVRPEPWRATGVKVPERALRFVAGPDEQADAIVERLVSLEGQVPAEEISIGVPDTGIIPWVEERLEEVGVPVRYGGGEPTEATPVWRLLSAVADYLRSREFDAFAALVRHPHIEGKLRRGPGGPGVEGAATLLDRYQREHLQSRIDAGALPKGRGSRSLGVSNAVQEARNAIHELLAPLDGVRPLSEWRQVLLDFLLSVYGAPPLQREVERERILLEVSRRIADALGDLEMVPEGAAVPMSGERVIRLLLRELRGGTIPPAAEEGAVELLGWLELALDDAEVLIVTGMNEPHLPESVSADPFLPHAIRQELGLLDNAGRMARDLFHLRTILEVHPEVLLLSGRRDAEGSPLLPSRLLLSGGVEEVAPRLLDFLRGSEGEGAGGAGEGGGEGAEGGASSLPHPRFDLPPQKIFDALPPPERIRVTDFGRFLQDPYRYLLERHLGLEEEDDRLRELDGMGFGSLAHTVLERFGKGAPAVLDPVAIRASLNEILEEEVRSQFGSRPLPALRLQVEQLRLRLGVFAERQAEMMQEGWRIAGVELDASGEEGVLDVDGVPVRLAGKVDRVDLHEGTGELRILDYKTGDRGDGPEKVHRKGRSGEKEWIDLQLPLYRYLAPALRRRDGTRVLQESGPGAIAVGYILLPRDPSEIRLELAEWTSFEMAEAVERAREVIRELRSGRIVYDEAHSAIRPDDPLAPVVGGGILRIDEYGAEDGDPGGIDD